MFSQTSNHIQFFFRLRAPGSLAVSARQKENGMVFMITLSLAGQNNERSKINFRDQKLRVLDWLFNSIIFFGIIGRTLAIWLRETSGKLL